MSRSKHDLKEELNRVGAGCLCSYRIKHSFRAYIFSQATKICLEVWQYQEKVVSLHPLLKPCDGELSTKT